MTTKRMPFQTNVRPSAACVRAMEVVGAFTRKETASSFCASDSQPSLPPSSTRCHSFQPPCSYLIENPAGDDEPLVAVAAFGRAAESARRRRAGRRPGRPSSDRRRFGRGPTGSTRRRSGRCSTSGRRRARRSSDSSRIGYSFVRPCPVRRWPSSRRTAAVRPIEAADVDGLRAEAVAQMAREIPIGPRTAAEQIQAQRAVLGKRMAREMRLREHVESGDAAGAGELVHWPSPHGCRSRSRDELARTAPAAPRDRAGGPESSRRPPRPIRRPSPVMNSRGCHLSRMDSRLSPIR